MEAFLERAFRCDSCNSTWIARFETKRVPGFCCICGVTGPFTVVELRDRTGLATGFGQFAHSALLELDFELEIRDEAVSA